MNILLPPSADSQLLKALHSAIDGLAKTLESQLTSLIGQHLESSASWDTIEEKLSAAMPEILAKAFISDFLTDKAATRHRRAMLAHLLAIAELRSVSPYGEATPTLDAKAVEVVTSEAAAKLLNVSRTHINKLVDEGVFGPIHRTEGGHRRIPKDAVLQHIEASKVEKTKGLNEMMDASARMGSYDAELAGIPVRGKR